MAERLVIASKAAEAAALKNGDSAFLAGGTEVNRLGTGVDAKTLISIGRVSELDGISCVGDCVRIGAMSTFQDIVESPEVPQYLKEACLYMGSRTKRNMATIGGNVALRRTDSYIYATLLACHAKLVMMDAKGSEVRKCAKGYNEDHEAYKDLLIVAIEVPKDAKVVSKRYANTVQSHAVLTVSLGLSEGKLRLGVAAKDTFLGVLPEISTALAQGELSDEQIRDMIALDFRKDIFGSPEYKRYLLSVTIADLAKKVNGGQR